MVSVEPRRAATAQSISPEYVHTLVLDDLVTLKAGEVVASQVQHRLPVRKFGLRSRRPSDDGHSIKFSTLRFIQGFRQRLRGPLVDEFIDFLLNGQTRRRGPDSGARLFGKFDEVFA